MRKHLPVAVTGLGCLCAAGADLAECMASLFAGKRQPKAPTLFTTGHAVAYPVFEAPLAEPEQAGLLRTSRLALVAAAEALADSGWSPEALRGKRVGVCIGTTIGGTTSDEGFCRALRAGVHPDLAPMKRILGSNPARSLAREFGFTGPSQTIVNACSSGTDAVGIGASWIRAGFCDLVLAGGADELGRVTYNGFTSLMITDESPVKPFDKNRKGLNLGEGAGMLVLESEMLRGRRNKAARGFVLGYGSACDAHHLTAPHPEGLGLKRALAEALQCSGLTPDAIAFVNAHGTGTPDNDRVESRVLSDVLPMVPFLSTKGYTGHTLGAAGAIEAVFTLACLEQRRIPANVGFSEPDPELPATPVREITVVQGAAALSESLAFGGNNAVLALGRGES
ncbi:MAG: beta-ketoacyl synthase [Desulfuromonadaceae bacterium GWC2_58_13]|nr:MAG: beta-ketoacyl synthase [Desulfuromonadaceae bacterium GWC2_58_13]